MSVSGLYNFTGSNPAAGGGGGQKIQFDFTY